MLRDGGRSGISVTFTCRSPAPSINVEVEGGGCTLAGLGGRRFLKDARQIESRFVITAAALRRPRGGSAAVIRGRHRVNGISAIRGSVRGALIADIRGKNEEETRCYLTTGHQPNASDHIGAGGIGRGRGLVRRRSLGVGFGRMWVGRGVVYEGWAVGGRGLWTVVYGAGAVRGGVLRGCGLQTGA